MADNFRLCASSWHNELVLLINMQSVVLLLSSAYRKEGKVATWYHFEIIIYLVV